jgi:hypothetical protein
MHIQLKRATRRALQTSLIAALGFAATTAAMAGTPLTLVNGWTNGPFSTRPAQVKTIGNVVHFSGAIASGTDAMAFTLPSGYLPTTDVYMHIDLCLSTNGRLHITPSGASYIEEKDGTLAKAQCFTSLDGASFALTADQYVPLTLKNGWTNAPFSTSNAAVSLVAGIVQFKGAISTTHKSAVPFTLPKAYRPATEVYVPVDMCNANKGRLDIAPTGVVTVEAEGAILSNAQCFTSLDGVSFAPNANGFTPLTLINGWTLSPYATSAPAAVVISGVTHLKGAMSTSGTSASPFILPAGMRPKKDVYVPLDLCDAGNGRLHITPSGFTDVEEEDGSLDYAACFTSLDGASFVN